MSVHLFQQGNPGKSGVSSSFSKQGNPVSVHLFQGNPVSVHLFQGNPVSVHLFRLIILLGVSSSFSAD